MNLGNRLLKIYGHPVSQPSRAIFWLLQMQNQEYEYEKIDPFAGDNKTESFLALNPMGKIPVLHDVPDDFIVWESPAILIYLCEKYDWKEWYPTNDLYTRTKIHQYLHWHHSNTRKSSLVFRNIIARHALGDNNPLSEKSMRTFNKRDSIFQEFMPYLDNWLSTTPYLASHMHPTIADITAYCELDQLEATDLFDFNTTPHVQQWMTRMKYLPKHDHVRKSLYRLAALVKEKPNARL